MGKKHRADATVLREVANEAETGLFSANPFLWPFALAASTTAVCLDRFAHLLTANSGRSQGLPEPSWSTPHQVALELSTMRLRDFSTLADGTPVLVCAPFALHSASVADFAPGHSLVAALLAGGLSRVYVTDWRSATPEMKHLSIDNYLAELNVVVDDIGAPVDLVGLCQGGWMALVLAARFPEKVRRIVLAGAPIDIHAENSPLAQIAADVPIPVFEELIHLGEGRILGHRVLGLWSPVFSAEDPHRVLQFRADTNDQTRAELEQRFRTWYDWTLDLPGNYYLQTVLWLFKENRIAEGRFRALGRTVRLADVHSPIFLLAARDDLLVSAGQLLATARLVGTRKCDIETAVEPCGHLSLFMGAETLNHSWPRITEWLGSNI